MLYVCDIEAVIKTLKVNKAAGSDELMAEHFKFAGGRLLPFLLTNIMPCLNVSTISCQEARNTLSSHTRFEKTVLKCEKLY